MYGTAAIGCGVVLSLNFIFRHIYFPCQGLIQDFLLGGGGKSNSDLIVVFFFCPCNTNKVRKLNLLYYIYVLINLLPLINSFVHFES